MDTPVTMQLTEDDVVAADRLYARSYFRDRDNWWRLFLVWLAAQGILLAIYLYVGKNSNGFPKFLLINEVVLLLILFVAPVLSSRVFGARNAKRHFKAMKILQQPIELLWSAEGLKETTETSIVLTPWDHFSKWREDEASFILYITPAMYRLIPKRFLTNAQIEDLRTQLRKFSGA
jgi:YcxB-like protein